jgi:nicotinamidase-related amidase
MHFNGCADGLLDVLRSLREMPIREVVIDGCEAHVCLMQTALGLLQAGLKVWVVAPACGSRSAENHELAMQRLGQAGAGIVSLEMVAFEWLRTCEHERFKAVLKLLKEQPVAG